jgi:hypothetical protein
MGTPATAFPIPTKTLAEIALQIASALDGAIGAGWRQTTTALSFDTVTRVMTLTTSSGAITVTIPETANVVTALTYNSSAKSLSYVDELGGITSIDLSSLAVDLFIDGGFYNAATKELTLTDVSGTTPDVVISFAGLVVAVGTLAGGVYPITQGGANVGNIDISAALDAAQQGVPTVGTFVLGWVDGTLSAIAA